MPEEIKPRYEFRVWSDDLGSIQEKLGRLAEPRRTESQETYLVSKATDRCNPKIRAGLMDIKILIAEDRGLQQWKPVLKAEFPLESSVITAKVFPHLELPPPELAKPVYSLDEFLDAMGSVEGVGVAKVRKVRYQYSIDACSAEYAQVTINNVPRDTVAVESTDPAAVLKLVAQLGITEANTSYVREVKRVLDQQS